VRRITISLSTVGCDKALKELEKFRKEIKPKLNEVCRRLAELGAEEARRIVSMVDPMEGNTDVTISTHPIENGWAISASGADVYFVEFGTGDMATSTHGFDVSVPVYPGSWSEGHGQKYSVNGYWWYNGQMLTETYSYAPMFRADRIIRENVRKISKEVFGK